MHLEKEFRIARPRDEAVAVVAQDETLLSLLPDTEIVEREGDRRTVRSHYRALGQEGTATFHFHTQPDGSVRFEKVCDGRVWKQLTGAVTFEPQDGGTRVRIELDGRTKSFVPEFTIKGPMHDQIEQMARALRERIESA